MEKIANPLDLELGVHGIYVVGKRGFGAGTYLPQVATEHHMTKEEFLSSCCAHKAGLPADAWRDRRSQRLGLHRRSLRRRRRLIGFVSQSASARNTSAE